MVIYRCGYIVMYSTLIIGKFRYIIIIIYEVPTFGGRTFRVWLVFALTTSRLAARRFARNYKYIRIYLKGFYFVVCFRKQPFYSTELNSETKLC